MHVEEGGLSRNLDAKQIRDLVATNVRGQREVIEVVRQGNAAEQILLAAREHDIDVIALTANHRLFLDLTIIGNTTIKVMRHADSRFLFFLQDEGRSSSLSEFGRKPVYFGTGGGTRHRSCQQNVAELGDDRVGEEFLARSKVTSPGGRV
jgi:hypothetical protein